MGEKTLEKFELYDMLGIVVPGVLLIAWMAVCFPTLTKVPVVHFPEVFSAVVLVALSFFLGQLIQAVGSILEPLMCWTWRGKHSARAFCSDRNPCLASDAAARVRKKIASKIGRDASDSSVYQYAAQLAETSGNGRVPRFNSLYAYHRALLVLILVTACTAPFAREFFSMPGAPSTLR